MVFLSSADKDKRHAHTYNKRLIKSPAIGVNQSVRRGKSIPRVNNVA